MSEIRANLISDAVGSGPATLNSQVAHKMFGSATIPTTYVLQESLNVASVTEIGAGQVDWNLTSAFATTTYAKFAQSIATTNLFATSISSTLTAAKFRSLSSNNAGTLTYTPVYVSAIGDLA